MTTFVVPAKPAAGVRYRRRTTGRTWLVSRICDSGLVRITEEFCGTDCERTGYVTEAELASEYSPVG